MFIQKHLCCFSLCWLKQVLSPYSPVFFKLLLDTGQDCSIEFFPDIWTANACPLQHLKRLVRICAAIALFVAMCVCCQIQLQKHSGSIPTNRANGEPVFEGSRIWYNTAIFLKIETLCFNKELGLATPLAPIHLETHVLSGLMLDC